MYINKIDQLIDTVIDDFYNKTINKTNMQKYIEEVNFVKYQLEINKLFVNYISNLNTKEINTLLKDEDNTTKLIEIIKRYISYYTMLSIAFFYKSKLETFINNIIEFSKNQPGFNFKVDNFFNSESNSNIIKYYTLIQNIKTIIDADNITKISQLLKKAEYQSAVDFLNLLGQEHVEKYLRLKNIGGDTKVQAHNLIKTIILNDLYYNQDKKTVHEFLESSEKEIGEFIYIDIVVPRTEYIDYNIIELSLSKQDIDNGLASEIYDLITQYENIGLSREQTHDDKILELLNRKLLIPITEDFLLYHKDSEKYEKVSGTMNINTQTKKKDDTKIKYIINKIDNVTEYFSKNVRDNKNLLKEIEKFFYAPLLDRRSILINNTEDIKILNKFQNQGRTAIENNEYYNDLITYKQYPYINFKDFQNYGFSITTHKTLDAIRSVTFEKNNKMNRNKPIQARVSNQGAHINIVGFIISSNVNDIKCYKLKDIIDIRKVGYKEHNKVKNITNGYDGALKYFKKILFNEKTNEKSRPPVYWMFDLDKDKFQLETYDITSKMNINEQMKVFVSQFYNDFMKLIAIELLRYIDKKNKKLTLQEFSEMIKNINKHIISFPEDGNLYDELIQTIRNEKTINLELTYDKKEDEFPGLSGDVIQLPSPAKKIKPKIETIVLQKFNKKLTQNDNEQSAMEAEQYGAICQHNITWDSIMALRTKNPNKYSELLYEFYQQYVTKNHEDNFICKSCSAEINLKNYVLDGTYDDDGRFVSFNTPMGVDIEDIPEYEKYKATIKNLEKIVERIASISNINTLIGSSNTIKTRIMRIVKDAIDLILVHNLNLKEIYKERHETLDKYGISKDLTNFFVFELDNSIFVYSSKDKDYFKPIKRNNILMYLLFLILLEFSDTQLFYMTGDKLCNYYLFSKYAINWFTDIYILKNNNGVKVPISNYKTLCYVIFYMSCLITKYNLWYKEDVATDKKTKFDPVIQKK